MSTETRRTSFCFHSDKDFEKVNTAEAISHVCLCVCLSVASHISETSETIALIFDTVIATVMIMHRVFMAFTFTQGHTDLNHENNKCSIIPETAQAIPIKFAVKIIRLKADMTFASPMTLTFTQSHNCASNVIKIDLEL